MTEYLTPDEIVELVDYIAKVVPDDLEQAQGQLEDIADLTSAYLGRPDAGKEE